MIKAFLLVLYPAATWDGVVQAKRSWQMILVRYLVPLWLIGFIAEGYGLIHWGKPQGFTAQIKLFSHSEALIFEILQQILLILVVFVGARIIKACGETFHGRNTFTQAFTVAAYGLGPLFTLHIFDMFSPISGWAYWVMWVIGILLSVGTLYHGIPRIMLPDPPHAFGLYITSSVMLLMVSGLVRFLTYSYLSGKFGRLDTLVEQIIGHLPFLQSFDQMHF